MSEYRKQRRLWWLRTPREIVGDVDDELAFHIEQRTQELIAAGLPVERARAQAERQFGDIADARTYMVSVDRNQQRRMRMTEFLGSIVQDVRFGVRGLLRDRGFTAVAVLTLALGIGANTAIYSLVDGVLLRALPYAQPRELVAVSPTHSFMRAEYALARERMQTVTTLAGYDAGVGLSVSGEGEAVRMIGARVSANLFATLRVVPMGRDFEPEHEQANRGNVAVISHRIWRQRFGGEQSALGRSMMIDGIPHEIMGIMPAGFAFPDAETDIWVPATIDPAQLGTYWGIGGMRAVGRLQKGATIEHVQAELRALGEPMRLANPFWTPQAPYRHDNIVQSLHDATVGNARAMLLVLMGAVALVWLIACANVGNLMLARGLARERELALRIALGAGRTRVLRQLLTESTLLSVIGGTAGLALAWIALRILVPQLPSNLPRISEIQIDVRILAFTMLASLCAAVIFGVVPALRVVSQPHAASLKDGARTGAGVRQRRLSSTVVIAEVALAVVLVAGAGLLLRSLENLSRVDTGFVADRVVTARLSPPAALYREPAKRLAFYENVLARVRGASGVTSAALTKQLPFDGEISLSAAAVEFVANDPNQLPMFELRAVTPAYFDALKIPVIEGRVFHDADQTGREPVAIVDRATAERFWPGESALGKRIGRPWMKEWRTIVGVVGTVRNNKLKGELTPALYLPLAQEPSSAAVLVVRTSAPVEAVSDLIRAAVNEADAGVPVSDIAPMAELINASAGQERAAAVLIGAFAALALILGAVGLYGVLSYAVTQRTRELSVRSALGATRGSLLGLILREGLLLGIIGIAIGIPAAGLAARALSSLLYGVEAADPTNLALVAAILLATCAAAALIPSLRAVRAQPADALRG